MVRAESARDGNHGALGAMPGSRRRREAGSVTSAGGGGRLARIRGSGEHAKTVNRAAGVRSGNHRGLARGVRTGGAGAKRRRRRVSRTRDKPGGTGWARCVASARGDGGQGNRRAEWGPASAWRDAWLPTQEGSRQRDKRGAWGTGANPPQAESARRWRDA
jgi:hypothetical protein